MVPRTLPDHLGGTETVPIYKPFLYWGAQNWTSHSKLICALMSVKKNGVITSLDLLATGCLIQPRKPLASPTARAHCWLMFSPLPIRIPRSFSAASQSVRPYSVNPQPVPMQGLVQPRCRTSHLAFVESMRFLLDDSSNLSAPGW